MIGIILAAGNGTRFGNAGCCKALNRINNITLIEHALNNLIALETEEICIVVGKYGEMIRETLGNRYKGIKIQYAYQEKQIGLINALFQAIAYVPEGENICLQLADEILIGLKAENIKLSISTRHSDFYCGITLEEDPERIKQNYSVEICDAMNVTRCIEKPTVVRNSFKGTGMCFFSFETLQLLSQVYDINTDTPHDLCDFMNFLIAEGKTITALCVAEKEFNINTPADLEEAVTFVRNNGMR